MTGSVHLLVGPVGAGKTTFARELQRASSALFMDLDTWMVRLFGADPRPTTGVIEWYLERRRRCRDLIWDLAGEVLATGSDAILELGLVRKQERIEAYEAAETLGALSVHLLDAPRNQRRERVLRRNDSAEPFTQVVPASFFEQASDAWEPPDEEELDRWRIRRQENAER